MLKKNSELEVGDGGEASECGALLGRCSSCVYWGNSRNYAADEGKRLKSCCCPKFEYGYSRLQIEEIPDDGAAIEDDEGWGMLTGPEFGCIHWATKSP